MSLSDYIEDKQAASVDSLFYEAHTSFHSYHQMAFPFIRLVLILLLFLPNFSFSCHAPVKCGDIDIHYPLNCRRKFPIECNGSTPTVKLGGVEYAVMNISYPEKVIKVQDQMLSGYFANLNSSFLYNFTVPINHFDPSRGFSTLKPISFFYHGFEDYELFAGILHSSYNSSACRDYNFYWYDSENQFSMDPPGSCSISKPTGFEWVLSFGDDDGNFSLLSAGFSSHMQLRHDCFHCHYMRTASTNCDGRDSSCKCENNCFPRQGKRISPAAIIGIAVGGLILGCCLPFLYNSMKKQRQSSLSNLPCITFSKTSSKKDMELGDTTYHTHIFSYDELEEATDGFNATRELGDGGFGTVYKGKLRDGRTVAVKRLYENNYRRLEQFMNEVEILSRLRHQNLVTLYGCTSRHSREPLLVYEFIPNGTVADHLHGPLTSKEALPWSVRMSIAIETADALAYLHSVEPQIIHRDVKTTNILLDDGFHVKVADFGLSRLFPLDATHVSTAPQGTPGYVDPEYHQCYQLTDKSDVYSFGVVLVELISSKPAVDISRHRHEINLSNMAITKIQNGQIDQLVDPELGYQSDEEIKMAINQVAELAFMCLQPDRDFRPCITEVLEGLKSIAGGRYNAEKVVVVADVQVKEDARLLKNVLPFSPDSVTERWSSRTTTPNTSSCGYC